MRLGSHWECSAEETLHSNVCVTTVYQGERERGGMRLREEEKEEEEKEEEEEEEEEGERSTCVNLMWCVRWNCCVAVDLVNCNLLSSSSWSTAWDQPQILLKVRE